MTKVYSISLCKTAARVVALAAGLLLVACTTTQSRPPSQGGDTGRVRTQPVTLDSGVRGTRVDPNSVAGRAPQDRVIYFDYDNTDIRSEYLAIITAHGRFLAQNSGGRVRLEGHTDERGTREYNVALGEGRAFSISRMMQLQGVLPGQISVISFGEELPVDEQQSEGAWAQNRRVNIIYAVD